MIQAVRATRHHRAADFALTVAASTAVVGALALVQHVFVLDVPFALRQLVLPLAVGASFGIMLAVVRRSREGERDALVALAAREAEITRLNADLEDRVRARTAELEEKTDALLRAQRLELLGRMAGGFAHDLNNVLTAVMACGCALRAETSALAPERRVQAGAILDDLDACTARARRLGREFLTLGRGASTGTIERMSLAALVEEMLPILRRLVGDSVQLQAVSSASTEVRADRSEVEQLLLNLTVNARDAVSPGDAIRISTERADAEVLLVVADTGCGMDDATRARIFEPFFTTKPVGRGTGLGLAVVAEVARRASARIDVTSAVGRGTRFCISFPAADDRQTAAQRAS